IRLIIDRLAVNGATVRLRPGDLTSRLQQIAEIDGLEEEYTLTLPPIELKDIGTADEAQNGAAIEEIATLLMNEMFARAAESEQLPREIQMVLKGDLSAV